MARLSDPRHIARLDALLGTSPVEAPLELILTQTRSLPPAWRQASVAETVRRLRERFDMTQRQLAALSGLPHSKIGKIEKGQDVRLSTLYQLFAGFGCGLVISPLCHLGAAELRQRTYEVSDQVKIPSRRRYPRR